MPQPALNPAGDRALQSDAELLRRVDWRFLLPDPRLGRVGYAGATDAMLVNALRATARSVEFVRAENQRFDIVVVNTPAALPLHVAVRAVKTGGHLFLQHSQYTRPSAAYLFTWLLGAAGWRAALRRAGIADAEAYWHWPDFARCRRIVPLDPAAVSHVLRKRSELAGTVAALAVRTGIAGRLLPHISIIGRKA